MRLMELKLAHNIRQLVLYPVPAVVDQELMEGAAEKSI